jgi:hypothetical protein
MRELRGIRFGLMWGRVNLMWQLLEKIKKNLSASPINLYIIDYRYRYRLLLSNGEIKYGYKCPD